MPRVFDEPACRRGDSRLAADALGERRHEGRAPGDAGAGDVEPQAYVEQVETAGGETPGQRDRLLEGLLAAVELDDAEAQGERQALRPDRAHCLEGLDEAAAAVLQRAAVLVAQPVGVRREEGLRPVPLGNVQL